MPITLLLLAIFSSYASTIRDGHAWDDDAAQYILHARNIAEGRPYGDTGYIFNPEYAKLGPPAYPPGAPLLLAPIWAISGLNLYAMKVLEVVCFVCSLGLIYALFRKRLGETACLVLVAVFGFCPRLWECKEIIGSDFPFLVFVFLGLLVIDHFYADTQPHTRHAFLIAPLIVLAYSVRTAGLVLVAALLAYDILRNRRVSRTTLLTAFLTAVLCGAEFLVFRTLGVNVSLFQIHGHTVVHNALTYARMLGAFWSAWNHPSLSWFVNGLAAALAVWSFAHQLLSKERPGIAEIFAVFYVALLLVYEPRVARFLFPVVPVYIALSLGAAERLLRGRPLSASGPVASFALTLVSLCYAGQYQRMNWGPIREGLLDQGFIQAADFVRTNTSATDILLFRKPRFLTLITGRRAATYAQVPGLGNFVRNLHPNMIIAATSASRPFAADAQFLWPFLHAHADQVRLVYANPRFSVFQVLR